jgi:Family of unknown function (DUF5706)
MPENAGKPPEVVDELTREERLQFLRHTYDCVDEQVRYSNSKASYILATVAAVFVACGAALLGPQVETQFAKLLLIPGLALTGVAGAVACITVFPVVRRRSAQTSGRSLMFFAAISEMKPADYAEAVGNLSEREIYDQMCQQIHALSCLAKEKYYWIRISTTVLAVALLLLFGAFMAIFMR